MKITFDQNKIQPIIDNFCNITKVQVCFFDADLHAVVPSSNPQCTFCSQIRKVKGLERKCMQSDKIHCEKAGKLKKAISYTCHAGIVETALPVFYESTPIGYILFGQYRDENKKYSNENLVLEACKKYGLDIDARLKEYQKLPVLTEEEIRSYIQILEVCIKYIWYENLIKLNQNSLSSKIIRYLDENFAQDLSIKQICDEFYIGSKSLYRIVKQQTGKTVFNYLTEKRVEKSKNLLLTTDKSVTEIALEVGYFDYNYFIRVFKRLVGNTPLQYRKNILK